MAFYRFDADFLLDPTIRSLSAEDFYIYHVCISQALRYYLKHKPDKTSEDFGSTGCSIEMMISMSGVDVTRYSNVTVTLQNLINLGLLRQVDVTRYTPLRNVTSALHVFNFKKFLVYSDDSRDRVRKYRATKKQSKQGVSGFEEREDVTRYSNVTVTGVTPLKEIYISNDIDIAHQKTKNEELEKKEKYKKEKKADLKNEQFEIFWKAYPDQRKIEKPTAQKQFLLALKKTSFESLMEALAKYKQTKDCLDGFAPAPHRWLKNERWLDGNLSKPTQQNIFDFVEDNPIKAKARQALSTEFGADNYAKTFASCFFMVKGNAVSLKANGNFALYKALNECKQKITAALDKHGLSFGEVVL